MPMSEHAPVAVTVFDRPLTVVAPPSAGSAILAQHISTHTCGGMKHTITQLSREPQALRANPVNCHRRTETTYRESPPRYSAQSFMSRRRRANRSERA